MAISGVGYEGVTLDSFISRLRLHSIDVVVDVRLNAISRKRGFSKKSLAAALEESGISYVHLPALGNQRENREGYGEITSRPGEVARERYRSELSRQEPSESLRELAGLATAQRVAVFCFEADERYCHREQVIEAVNELLERDLVRS